MEKEKITVVMLEPGKKAYVEQIGTTLEELQEVVGGFIETFYPFEEEICIVCNDEGKLNGMAPCRAIYGEDEKISDILFGPCFICGCGEEDFSSLTDEQIYRMIERFENPERFYRKNGSIIAVPYEPATA